MKKSLITLAVLAASGAASAQSSVTLFGVVDATVRYVDAGTGGSVWSLTNSGYQGSRLGFRGTEDLGGGLSTSFWLEAGVNNDNGTGRLVERYPGQVTDNYRSPAHFMLHLATYGSQGVIVMTVRRAYSVDV